MRVFVLHSTDGRMLQRVIQQEMNALRKAAGGVVKRAVDTVESGPERQGLFPATSVLVLSSLLRAKVPITSNHAVAERVHCGSANTGNNSLAIRAAVGTMT